MENCDQPVDLKEMARLADEAMATENPLRRGCGAILKYVATNARNAELLNAKGENMTNHDFQLLLGAFVLVKACDE